MTRLSLSLFLLLFLLTLTTCTIVAEKTRASLPLDEKVTVQALKAPYEIDLGIQNAASLSPNLIVSLKLAEGSHYISPHSSRSFSGKFSIKLNENQSLKLGSDFIETPRSVETFDPHPFTGGLVNWVRINTRYQYPLHVHSKGDFEVSGSISFTIEPRCTMEIIGFVVKQKNGKLSIEK